MYFPASSGQHLMIGSMPRVHLVAGQHHFLAGRRIYDLGRDARQLEQLAAGLQLGA